MTISSAQCSVCQRCALLVGVPIVVASLGDYKTGMFVMLLCIVEVRLSACVRRCEVKCNGIESRAK